MFESQPIETAIGLVLMFFVIALAASSLVDVISQVFKLRANDLETAIGQMLTGQAPPIPSTVSELSADERTLLGIDANATDRALTPAELTKLKHDVPKYDPKGAIDGAIGVFKGTSVYEAAAAGARRGVKWGKPSYLAARSFADSVGEILGNVSDDGVMSPEAWDGLPEGLKRRLVSLSTSADAIAEDEKQRALAIRSGLEQWFDDTMARASGAYKRWTKWWLFGIGLLIAIVANASAFHVAERLWADPPTRSAVVSSAGQVAQQTDPSQNIPDVAHATSRLEELKLPIGWDAPSRSSWNDLGDYWSWRPYVMLLGWIVTGLLVTLGAPFWFNLLTQLASLRSTGAKPPPAAQDGASATSLQQDLASAAPAVFAVRPPPPEPGVGAEEAAGPGAVPAARGGPPPARRSASQKAAAAFGLRKG